MSPVGRAPRRPARDGPAGTHEMPTLIARTDADLPGRVVVPAGADVRPCRRSDADGLGRLYFEAYEPGIACDTLDEAVADIHASFEGDYGELWPAGSLLIERGGEPIAALLTVRRAPWDGTPDGPFVIELFTARAWRRQGLARLLVQRCLAIAREEGEPTVALRVDPDNAAARSLYASLGFTVWRSDSSDAAHPR